MPISRIAPMIQETIAAGPATSDAFRVPRSQPEPMTDPAETMNSGTSPTSRRSFGGPCASSLIVSSLPRAIPLDRVCSQCESGCSSLLWTNSQGIAINTVELAKGGGFRMQTPLLSQVLDALGPSPLHLATAPSGTDAPVSGVLIHEPRAALPPVRHAMLLAVGLRPSGAEAGDLVWQASHAGHAAVVVKGYGEPVADLAAVAGDAGIALLAADEDMAWHHLDALVSSALAAIARSGRGGAAPAMGDLFALANAIAAMAGGATAIEDPNRRILAYSTLPGQLVDEDRRQGILGLQVPDLPENDAQYRELGRTAEVRRFTGGPGSMPRLAIAVRAGADLLGSIWVVDPDGRLGPEAGTALAEAAEVAALHLLTARTAADLARRQRGDLLRRLLADPASAAIVAPQL